jgi:putative FmdB family regulatory protein
MPLYEFECDYCGVTVELLEKKYKESIKCPYCGGEAKKIMSSTNFSLKGGGWASSGYSKENK